MTTTINNQDGLLLPGLDGTNPLGFLAALGVLNLLSAVCCGSRTTMRWEAFADGWRPVIGGFDSSNGSLENVIAKSLRCSYTPNTKAENSQKKSQGRFDAAKKKVKRANDDIKNRRLRGKELDDAKKEELLPLECRMERRRQIWLRRLRHCVPSAEMALGKHLNADVNELREAMLLGLSGASCTLREVVDMLASFGSDCCFKENSSQMEATPFCFITGSGHQYFLDTVRQLTSNVDDCQIRQVLLDGTNRHDEKLSMRWDPIEDRRYAMMWDDPTASNNKPTTNWVLNLLAYRGLQLCPTVPTGRGLEATGWSNGRNPSWTWALWTATASFDVVRSLLAHKVLQRDVPDNLGAIGVAAVYRAQRIQVGNPPLHKINFTPAQRIA